VQMINFHDDAAMTWSVAQLPINSWQLGSPYCQALHRSSKSTLFTWHVQASLFLSCWVCVCERKWQRT